MSDPEGTLSALSTFLKSLSPKKLFLGTIAALVLISLYVIYENRLVVFLYIIKSPAMLWGIGIASAVILFTWLILVAVSRVEEMFEERISDQDDHISELRKDLDDCRLDCREINTGILKQILDKVNEK